MLKHNKQKTILLTAMIAGLGLSGCTWFSANDGREEIDDSYLQSRQQVVLQIPADASEIKQNDNYQIPEGAVIVNRQPKGQDLGLEPPQLLLSSGDGVREDQDAKHPTVWLRGDSSQFKKIVDGFVNSNNIQVINTDSRNLKTDWLSDEEDGLGEGLGSYNIDGQRHKFDLALVAESANEFGVQALHSASEQYMDGEWRSIETSDRVAKQFLNQFIGYYDGVRDTEARSRILAEGSFETRLGTNPAGHIAIIADRDLQSVWQYTPAVLQYLNLIITDRDQTESVFYFKVEEPSGFFGSLFSKNKEAKVDLEPGDYQLQLESRNNGTSLTFKNDNGDLLSPNLVGKLYPEFSAAYRSRQVRK